MNSNDNSKKKPSQPQALGNLLKNYQLEDKGGYITQEFQDFGYRMAVELGDLKHKSLYIKLAKTTERHLLEKALSFVKDAGAKNPGALFMWKLKQLKEEEKSRKKEEASKNTQMSLLE